METKIWRFLLNLVLRIFWDFQPVGAINWIFNADVLSEGDDDDDGDDDDHNNDNDSKANQN